MGSIVMVTDGPAAWMKMGPQSRALPGSQASEMRRGISTGYGCLGLLQQALAGKVEGQALGRKDFEGQSSEAVLVRFEDRPVTVYLAPDGSAVLGTSSWQHTEEGLAEFTTVYSDWRASNGLLLPQSTLTKSGGKTKATAKVDSAKINAGYDAAIFEKPTS